MAGETVENAEFVIAGWSEERDRPEAYGVQSHSRDGLKAWTLYEIPEVSISPADPALVARLGSLDLEEVLSDPESLFLQIMECQREGVFELEGGQAIVAAGKFCQLTTLTRAGVYSRILKRWPLS